MLSPAGVGAQDLNLAEHPALNGTDLSSAVYPVGA